MRLIKEQSVSYCEYICTGTLTEFAENEPLARMLTAVMQEGEAGLEGCGVPSAFVKGMLASFQNDGYCYAGKLTRAGKEVVDTKKCWRTLRGQFKLGVVRSDRWQYIISCEPYYKDERVGFVAEKHLKLNFFGEYQNDRGMHIKELKLDAGGYVTPEKEIPLECVYDYETDQNSYTAEVNGKKIGFPENPKTFKLMDSRDSGYHLLEAIGKAGGILQGSEIYPVLTAEAPRDVLEQIFHKGEFDLPAGAGARIEGIRACIEDGAAVREVLLAYLERIATQEYLSVNEIGTRIAPFYLLFANCVDVDDSNKAIFDKLLTRTSVSNKTAYLRLCAFRDLDPEPPQAYEGTSIDFSGRTVSIAELAKDAFRGDVCEITALTKYAYKNASVSRAFGLLANAVKRRYNIPLTLITATDTNGYQSDVAREYFDALKANPNVNLILRDFGKIKRIHDRYFRIKRHSGRVEWLKMTTELDSLRYQNDFVDGRTPAEGIDENTLGRVRELTAVYVEKERLFEVVLEQMEGEE